MRLPQFRLRTLMIAVAVSALLFEVGIAQRRIEALALTYRDKAHWNEDLARLEKLVAAIEDHLAKRPGADSAERRRRAARARRLAEHYLALSRKYRKAADFPWIPLPPDPPQPK